MPAGFNPIHAVSFGKKGCDDLRIAQRVAKVKGAKFHPIEINAQNWLTDCTKGIWWTDGECSVRQLQFISVFQTIQENQWFDFNLHGMGAGGVIGGDLLFKPEDFVKKYLEKRLGINYFIIGESNKALIERYCEYFNSIDKNPHILCLDNRNRSFGIRAAKLNQFLGIENRFPFVANSIQELIYAVPNETKQNNRLYEIMLLEFFPGFYKKIPWQTTGVPIGPPDLGRKIAEASKRFQNKLNNKLKRLGMNIESKSLSKGGYTANDYADHQNWLRQEPSLSLFEEVLNNPSALYAEYVSKPEIVKLWKHHLQGEDMSDKLCRIFTVEIWLQQVLEGNYR
ncbi:hypothetical protein [Phormidium sp. CCY1219]|uniref:hypothetical protein n=1 Tax=Phormidium sp. CCY1219 TaxID=2886104 RepID=UPI002D1F901B|nr:hypothetical protein [Phormidium sp. CCY1219]MEB3827615.1 hypothetical protein [Phormidium sp. CCY1219]